MEKNCEQVDTYEEIVWTIESSSAESRSPHGENSSKLKRKRSGDDDAPSESENEACCSEKFNPNWREASPGSDYETSLIPKSKKKKSPNSITTEIAIAEPLIRCVWNGNCDIWHEQSEFNPMRNYRLNAFLSSKACDRERRAADRLESNLEFVVVERHSLWPESFGRWGPTDEAISLFFFPPSPEHEKAYDSFVNEMICDDLAMTACVTHQDYPTRCCDLVVFTSVELPWACRRYQGKFYLWGVFRRCNHDD